MGLEDAADIDFKYTTMSLNDVYELGFKHTLQVIQKNGGKVAEDSVIITVEQPVAVRLEQSFEGHYPVEKRELHHELNGEYTFEFEGIGFALLGGSEPVNGSSWTYKGNYFATAELHVDGIKVETVELPANFINRRHELFWRYQMPRGKHSVTIKQSNPNSDFAVRLSELVVYDNASKTTK
jgi:hypothetical protein